MNLVKFQASHGMVAGAPSTLMVAADDPILMQRQFSGAGAPSAATLPAGNGRYCAATSGFIIAATLYASGSGYAVNNVLTLGTGTATTTLQIAVDEVDGAGKILDYHVSRAGVYTAYPNATAGVTGGAGTGAVFMPALQPADHYLDISSPDNPVLYICTTAGSNATSAWKKISGGGAAQFKIVSDGGDYWNCRTWDGTTTGADIVKVAKPFKLRCATGAVTTENIRGTVQTYAYSNALGYYVRSVSVGAVLMERNVILPDPVANDLIYAVGFSTTAPATLVDVVWLDLNLDGREWAEI
jgi:hypothetical protein